MLVGLDPGHGGSNVGAHGNGIAEEAYVLDLCNRVGEVLQKLGVAVAQSRISDETVSFGERARRLVTCDLVLVVHVNAHTTPVPKDLRCFTLTGDAVAEVVGREIERSAPAPIAPKMFGVDVVQVGSHAYNTMVNHQPRPVVLVETFFLSNPETAAFANSPWGRGAIACSMAAGVMRGWQRLQAPTQVA